MEYEPDDTLKEKDVFENLQPPRNLKELSIRHYGGAGFPNWFGGDSLSNVVFLELRNCGYCFLLPPLGLLPALKTLHIIGLDGIMAIGPEFYGNSSSTIPFGYLEILRFQDMVRWEEWDCKNVLGAFPRLRELYLENCSMLKEHLPEQLPSLVKLVIDNCQQLVASVPRAQSINELVLEKSGKLQLEYLPPTLKVLDAGGSCMEGTLLERIGQAIANTCLEELRVYDCPNMEIPISHCHNFLIRMFIESSCGLLRSFPLDFFPKLRMLSLERCTNLEMISVSEGYDHNLTSLTKLRIRKCPKFVLFPRGGLSTPKLLWCEVEQLENLKSLPESMHILLPSLRELHIKDCPQLESFPQGGLPSNLKNLYISKCSKLISSLKWGLHTQSSLLSLSIVDVDVESFPDQGLLPASLTGLFIHRCPNLKKLDYKGLCHLSSLNQLYLEDCPRLQCLAEEGLPKSISTLVIEGNCPLLKQRCQKPKGQDWGKIAHIHCVRIDNDIIT